MSWRARLCWLGAWSCAATVGPEESAGGPICEGLNGCYSISTLKVYQGERQSLSLSLNSDWQLLLMKCDPKTGIWNEEVLFVRGKAHSLTDKTTSNFLIDGNFTVQNAEKADEGLYKIVRYVNGSFLAAVNITVLDLPSPMAVIPSFDVSSTVTSNVTEAPKTSPPGTDYTAAYVSVVVGSIIILTVVGVLKLIKSKRRPNKWDPPDSNETCCPEGESSVCIRGVKNKTDAVKLNLGMKPLLKKLEQ